MSFCISEHATKTFEYIAEALVFILFRLGNIIVNDENGVTAKDLFN